MKHKSDVSQIFMNFYNFVLIKFGTKIKGVRSDNAHELVEGTLKSFYNKKGMFNQTSFVGTPHLNSIVERKYIDILNIARALRFQAYLSL